jgi:hypothetical protein
MEKTERTSPDYAAVLADLEAKRAELDSAIAVIKREMGMSAAPTQAGHAKQSATHELTPTAFFGMSVGDAAKKYLSIVKEDRTTPAIADALLKHGLKTTSKNFSVTVFSALERKEDAGELVRPKRGLWGLPQWYPGFRPKKDNGDKKESSNDSTKKKDPPSKLLGLSQRQAQFSIPDFEAFVRQKPRRMNEVLMHFAVLKSVVTKSLEPESKVYKVGIGWLRVRE